ncbi:hypothetical protein H8K35_03135 [Undibacterium sp. LX40W]|uniref:Uncharacterized protein n=1 Tax=Undibacterium nitidum TaxID=2762298 RepID=A0A923KSL1_9BURK|nr:MULTISPECIES: hypothetical protein [Undibacterium]MBC3880619.1 hypothetical protein [Undibacterium nitidum]MBC3890645.1 hypothetical protein [Undibacterium sp. LX40W]
MSENSLWLVPSDQNPSPERLWEIAEQLWTRGIIPMLDLADIDSHDTHAGQAVPYNYFDKRYDEWKASGRPLPTLQHGDFDSVWIKWRPYQFLVPSTVDQFCDLRCPHCQTKVTPSIDCSAGALFGQTVGAVIRCRQCERDFPATSIEFDPTQATWAQCSVSFHQMPNCEVSGDEQWLIDALAILGPCRQLHGWET